MDRLHSLTAAVSRGCAVISGGLLLLSAIIVGVDVAMRALLNRSIGGSDELSGYALAIATAWGLSHALIERAHIRVASLYEVMPALARSALDVLGLLGFLAFMFLTTQYAWTAVAQSLQSGARSISPLATPIVIPQAVWFAGFVFLLLVVVLLITESSVALLRGDLRKVSRLIGAKGINEELSDERLLRMRAGDRIP